VSEDLREAVDQLEADMAAHVQRRGGEVKALDNKTLAASAIERLEREQADVKPAASVRADPAQPVQLGGREIKDVDGKKYIIDKNIAPLKFRTASEFEEQVLKHAMPRIALLLSKNDTGILGLPSWRQRTEAAMYFKVKSLEAAASNKPDLAEHYERAFQLDVEELLEASNQPFGDWRKGAPQKLIIAG
jgi:hypothetical protein